MDAPRGPVCQGIPGASPPPGAERRRVGRRPRRPAWIDDAVLAHADLLAEEWQAAHQLAAGQAVLGWSRSDNPQGVVVPFFLVRLSGKRPGTLPSNLQQLWGEGLQQSLGFAWGSEGSQGQAQLRARLERAYAACFPGGSWSPDQQADILSWCLDVTSRRVSTIGSEQHRGSYGNAAVLVAACAETLRLRGRAQEAGALMHPTFESHVGKPILFASRGAPCRCYPPIRVDPSND